MRIDAGGFDGAQKIENADDEDQRRVSRQHDEHGLTILGNVTRSAPRGE